MAAIGAKSSYGATFDVGAGAVVLPEVTKWTINPKAENGAYASSSTAGWKKRVKGTLDASGTIDIKWDSADPIHTLLQPGLVLNELALYLDQIVNYAGPAIIDDISVEVDIDTGAPVSATINWSGNGAWTDYNEA